MFCPSCGKEIVNVNAKFCPGCGFEVSKRIAGATPAAAVTSPNEKAPLQKPQQTSQNSQTASIPRIQQKPNVSAAPGMSQTDILVCILAIAAALLALCAPWLELGVLGSDDSFTFFGELSFLKDASSLVSYLSLSSDELGLLSAVMYVFAGCLVVGVVCLAYRLIQAFKGGQPGASGKIGFGLIAAVVLIHNLFILANSSMSLFGYSFSVGGPTMWSWLLLGVSAVGLFCA